VKLPVRSRSLPTRSGLVADAKIPQELMKAIPAGRAAADRIAGGTVQNTAIAANAPMETPTRPAKRNHGSGEPATRTQPKAARTMGRTVCIVRSFLRSDRALQRGMTSAVRNAGMATTIPTNERLLPSSASRAMVGVQVALVLGVIVRPK
jgi:hypothetical protein